MLSSPRREPGRPGGQLPAGLAPVRTGLPAERVPPWSRRRPPGAGGLGLWPLPAPTPRARETPATAGSSRARGLGTPGCAQQGRCGLSRWPPRAPRWPLLASRRHPGPLRTGGGCPSSPLRTLQPTVPGRTPSFMLQCCTVSASERGLRSRDRQHCPGIAVCPPKCLPGVVLAEAARCVSLSFPGKMD